MLKVTFFLNQFPVASETFVINQIIGLINRGADVRVVAICQGDLTNSHKAVSDYNLLDKTTYLTNESVTDSTLKTRLKRIANVLWPKRIGRKLASLNVARFGIHSKSLLLPSIVTRATSTLDSDVFIAHFGTAGVVANKMRELGLLKGKLVTVFHGADISVKAILDVFKQDYQMLFKNGELMLPISDLWKNRLIEQGCAPEKIIVNRMGINNEQFKCRELATPISTPLKIISVARFIEKKGLSDALDAMHHLKQRGVDFEYKIVGDGDLKEQLVSQIDSLGLSECVKLLGFQPQEKIAALLNEADVFLLPSVVAKNGDMEGIPVALMEAMAMGLITVSTYHSGIPELITHNESGLLAQEHSPAQLTDSIESLVNGQVDIVKMRAAAKAKVEEHFDQAKLYTDLLDILVELNEH
ncbi:colanic acid biosynthesis glycosyltransferase WcaL [Pseudoalteromonas lipolytica SCSIO 04301]|uniref:Colanic acid/amylovoran biosynthesis glycosyltransferase n=1 Tax=Pseudoalteromonas lipolytica TaxID=570156 RepID=A0ABY1GSD3_9GAMM|nr:glycosyltransferase [Pseudoalteromonas lipolytica]EWH04607.1 colanic acid biosynthesis glycosyltransferase WcaL [Pseudoalteromonas lipolytica SCSIO 04301]MBE0349624.1 colanic acid/amylovoran biosynthesis glycosyltransferase [Pseudoalteromonas lipolytica LMEB 39]SFT78217.1 colanic acid/amylovoran biosynthesis glycosyltransferase [Pseudoalteromonas lipolytica]